MTRVLIVEDSQMLCRILKDMMEKYTPFAFDFAHTYKEARNNFV